MRVVRTVVITLVVVAVVAVVADGGARRWTEDRLATRIQSSQQLPEQPSVTIGGTPFLVQALRGRYDDVQLRLGPVSVPGGPPLTSVQARLTGVSAPLSSLGSAAATNADPDVRADLVDAQAMVSYSALTSTFGSALPTSVSGITLAPATSPGDLRVRLSYAPLGVAVPIDAVVHLAVQGGKLVATTSAASLTGVQRQYRDQVARLMSFSTAVPALPYGLKISGLSVQPDGIAFTAAGRNVSLGAG